MAGREQAAARNERVNRMTRPALILGSIAAICGAIALRFFPGALPTVALEQRLSRPLALQRADSFFHAHGLAPPAARVGGAAAEGGRTG